MMKSIRGTYENGTIIDAAYDFPVVDGTCDSNNDNN